MSALGAVRARRRYLLLLGLRWLASGLIIPILVLLPLDRGLTLSQVGAAGVAQGLLVLALELPTGGLADALGRRPVLLLAGFVNLASFGLLAVAGSLPLFVAVFALQGVYRALDSGPLDAWYVDAALAADPEADIEGGLSRGGVVTGLSIAGGALAAGGLVALDPLPGVNPLAVPVLAAIAVQALSLVAVALLLAEVRPAGGAAPLVASVRQVPGTVRAAFGLLRRSRVLLAVVAVELFWGFGMVTFEMLLPVRLTEVVGDADTAAALLGPAGSAAWVASAAGAALVPLAAGRIGAPWTGAVLRVLQGATVVGMALLAGPVGVLAAYLLCYVVHGAANPVHMGLLHRQVDGPYRTTVLSLNSMMAQPAGALGLLTLTALADATSVSAAMLVGAAVLAAAAPLYLVARHKVSDRGSGVGVLQADGVQIGR
ncbi:MFS transporter [Phytohabitans sp. ZYX-F-186]|uniref:MFS transporter n=1 Tax=Phytohabitans maris TaxID=3071409 RepID=A0ABU0ZGZ6_9ACTN|nr:MFS transporter [Phytohabitans sp. ZYX-F-186]MDQ7906312.1 MFS transporter [Phytohabitans sp. ZYX-F-186]